MFRVLDVRIVVEISDSGIQSARWIKWQLAQVSDNSGEGGALHRQV